ncbi:MAG: transcriptional regulator [Firmicutes bacterium HGW-Firmicutes-7]|nr:MAG: transcriptional regulator [Firmicutes bacterium HGW-Firmicutes-7]
MENNVKLLREELGFSQGKLAEVLGVSRQTINSIENNRYSPSIELAFKLSRVFQKSIEDIFIYREEKYSGKR